MNRTRRKIHGGKMFLFLTFILAVVATGLGFGAVMPASASDIPADVQPGVEEVQEPNTEYIEPTLPVPTPQPAPGGSGMSGGEIFAIVGACILVVAAAGCAGVLVLARKKKPEQGTNKE